MALDGDRRPDLEAAEALVNRVHDELADSDLLESLQADSDAGTEAGYPHAEHADAVRALRRYRDALNDQLAGRGPGVLTEPMTRWEAVEAADEDGRLTVTVLADLGELVNTGYGNDAYTVDDLLAERAVNGMLPYDASYEVVGLDGEGKLLVQFTTNIGAEIDDQYGVGMFTACKDGTDAAVCVDCDTPYELGVGHDCPEAGPDDDGGCEHRAYVRTCDQCL